MPLSNEPVLLRITFTPRGEGATLRWEADLLGVRLSRLVHPFPLADLPLILRALDVLQDPAYPVARTAAQTRHFSFDEGERARLAALNLLDDLGHVVGDAPRRLGQSLYAALTTDPDGRTALESTYDHAVALGVPLHLELGFPADAARLAALPWELLWDDGAAPLLFSRGLPGSLTRRLDLARALPPTRRVQGPLRILAISPTAGIGPELRQIERAARQEALAPLINAGLAMVEEIEPADRQALARAITAGSPPDIIHFYGHGRLRGREGELLLDEPRGGGWLSSGAMASLVGGVGLVALFACQGASVGVGSGEPLLGGVAQALVAAGAPAVLGMQLAVRAHAATRAAATIYAALAAGESLQHGVAQARRALFIAERDGASWFVPALYVRERTGQPYHLRPVAANAQTGATLPPGARQSVIARGGTIRSLRIQGRTGSNQRVFATAGGTISDVTIRDIS